MNRLNASLRMSRTTRGSETLASLPPVVQNVLASPDKPLDTATRFGYYYLNHQEKYYLPGRPEL
jgi:hypothetical protein